MTTRLTHVRVAGFRSLRDVSLDLTPVTVPVGPNGAGKSNLLWALEMVRYLASDTLQLFVGERGGAGYLLHYGPQQTPAIELGLEFASDAGDSAYSARLGYSSDDRFVFEWERAGARGHAGEAWSWSELGAGHQESRLPKAAVAGDTKAKAVLGLLRQISFYHFHDTSRRSALRTRDFADLGSDWLRPDGRNLAAFLDGLRGSRDRSDRAAWNLIEATMRRIAPCVDKLLPHLDEHGFKLDPSEVVVAERTGGATGFRRLDGAELASWLTEHRLSELYDSNLIGGRP